jgi:hypothetical protein
MWQAALVRSPALNGITVIRQLTTQAWAGRLVSAEHSRMQLLRRRASAAANARRRLCSPCSQLTSELLNAPRFPTEARTVQAA